MCDFFFDIFAFLWDLILFYVFLILRLISASLSPIDSSFLAAWCSEWILFLSFFEIFFYFYAKIPVIIFDFSINGCSSSAFLVLKSRTLWVIFASVGFNKFAAGESGSAFLGFLAFSCYARAYFLTEYSSVISMSLITAIYISRDNSFTTFFVATYTWAKACLEMVWVTFYVVLVLVFPENSSATESSGIVVVWVSACAGFFDSFKKFVPFYAAVSKSFLWITY